jgi:DNA-binding NarL/FixJ family response regulator
MGTYAFLIVEDDALLARSLSRMLRTMRRGCDVEVAGSLSEAKELLFSRPWDALFFDYFLPDGPGLDALAMLRARGLPTPAIVLSGALDDAIVNRACDLRALPMAKPMQRERIERFLETLDTRTERILRVARTWQVRYELSDDELDVLVLTANGLGRAQIAQVRARSERTIGTYVTHLLRKTRDATLQAAAGRLLRETVDVHGN